MNYFSIITRYSRIFSERKLQEYDIGFSEECVLLFLSRFGNINQDTIAKHFMIDKGSIAKTAGKLEEKGFIQRYPNPENKREYLISLTPKGTGVIGQMGTIAREWDECVYEGLSEEDVLQLNRIMEVMASNVMKAAKKNWSDPDGKHE